MSDEPAKSRGGRPRLEQPKVTMSARVLAEHYDRLVRQANARNESVSKYVSGVIGRHLNPSRKSH